MGEEIGWLVSPFLTASTTVPGHARSEVGRCWSIGRTPGQARGERAGRLPRLAKGRRRRRAGRELSGRQPAGRGHGAAARGAHGRRDSERRPPCKAKYGRQADAYLEPRREDFREVGLARLLARGQGRRVVGGAGIRIDRKTGQLVRRLRSGDTTEGFSNPDNKENLIARWLLAMYDVTGKPVYRERAEKWFRLMKSRMKTPRRRPVLRLELLGTGRPVGLQADGSTQALGGRPSQRRLLRHRPRSHRGGLRARPGLHAGPTSSGSSPPTAISCGTRRSKARS